MCVFVCVYRMIKHAFASGDDDHSNMIDLIFRQDTSCNRDGM